MTETSAFSACPACNAAPLAASVARANSGGGETVLSLPNIHCAGCIRGVEGALLEVPGVKGARVNLSRKRVSIDAGPVEPEALVEVLAEAGYEAQVLDAAMVAAADTDAAGRQLLLRIAVAGFAMMNVMLFSVAVWSGASQATQHMFHWIAAGIAVPALFFSAQVFVTSAWGAVKHGRLNMDVPISLAIILATGLSVYETAAGGERVYFDAALSLTFFLLAGRYLDHRTRMAARSASQELSALESPRAVRVTDGAREHVNVADLAVGDEVLVSAGMRIPVDGTVIKGASDIDRALLTGESLAVAVAEGDALSAGEENISAPLHLRVTAVGEDTTLRRMAAMIETAENARSRYTALADRAAKVYAPVVHLLALVTFIGWIAWDGNIAHALNVAISVLIITCPCALGLAVPAVMTAATGRLFRKGLLVKDATALERLAEVDSVVFDKTGTLTTGRAVVDGAALSDDDMAVLASLADASEHPVSKAIAAALPGGLARVELTDVSEHPGKGVEAIWNGRRVRLGHGSWVGAEGSPAFAVDGQAPVVLPFTETLREGTGEMVARLKGEGVPMSVLSGDSAAATGRVAALLDIDDCAEVTPAEKVAEVERLRETGRKVLMVGDGLNDAAALRAAHASMSPASALDASRTASDIVILGQNLTEIPEAIFTARSARRRVLENFAIAAGYNCIAIPIAVLGHASPLAAAIAMSTSSITVLLNAMRLR
ncbi:MAG: heavy metal translocating P-type ATPase [Silicimonas sp.]|nr:heavy metal translocating P-type ATPase [Silicimonas sp.]